MNGQLARLFVLFVVLGALAAGSLLAACSVLLTYWPYLVASIVFPSEGLTINAQDVVVLWHAAYRPRQVVVFIDSGPRIDTPDHTLYLDGKAIAAGDRNTPPMRAYLIRDLRPGTHILRLEAHAGGRTVVHEVTFTVQPGSPPWQVHQVPLDAERDFLFDAQGRPVTLPHRPDAPLSKVAHLDHRGLFEMGGAFSNREPRVRFYPWVREQLGQSEDLPLPAGGRGLLVGPGLWLADHLYAWTGETWQLLPPLPVPPSMASFLEEGRTLEALVEMDNFLFWARTCGESIWTMFTWIIPKNGRPDYIPYLARYSGGRWELIPAPTEYGAYALFCFDSHPLVVAIASANVHLQKGQFTAWGLFPDTAQGESYAEGQNLGYTFVWAEDGWRPTGAPPLGVWIDQQGNWFPTPYGPGFAWLEGDQYLVAVPGGPSGPR